MEEQARSRACKFGVVDYEAEKTTLSHDARYDDVGWGCTFSSQLGQAESSCSGMTCNEKQAFPQIGLQYIPKLYGLWALQKKMWKHLKCIC